MGAVAYKWSSIIFFTHLGRLSALIILAI